MSEPPTGEPKTVLVSLGPVADIAQTALAEMTLLFALVPGGTRRASALRASGVMLAAMIAQLAELGATREWVETTLHDGVSAACRCTSFPDETRRPEE